MTAALVPVLILFALGASAHGSSGHASPPSHGDPAPEAARPPAAPAHAPAEKGEHNPHLVQNRPADDRPMLEDQEITPEEIASILRIAEAASNRGDYDSADIAYRQVLAAYATPDQDRKALLGLARMYRRKNDLTRAAAVYEKIIKEFPADAMLPNVYLELGRTHRALGAHRLAINRFYSVINSTLKLPEHGADLYRQLARTAQFEIAETYFVSGDYNEAATYFSRLKLLDLAPVDRARAHFKSLYALHLAGDHEKAVSGLRGFLEQSPQDENAPEARYLLSVSLRRLNRNQESLAAALDLLKSEQSRTADDPKRWAYWQRRTGNQLANEFYEQGDASSALSIYLSLANLSEDPTWRLPVLYQVGLCYERLRSEERAIEQYRTVIAKSKELDAKNPANSEVVGLADMAAWRIQQLDWQQATDRQVNAFFQTSGTAPRPAPTNEAPPSPSPAAHPAAAPSS